MPEQSRKLTTASGRPYVENDNTMTVGPRGPVLLQDYILHEKMAHFNRERIPERVVHAKGTGAYGTFTVTHDITRYTRAKLFNRIGKQTRVFVRFSTVGGEKGSADNERVWVKFHFKTLQGIKNFTHAEALAMRGQDPDWAQRDLVEAIDRGEYPQWALKIQVMTDAQAQSFRWNPFDLTKIWPHREFPLIDVGVMTLNEIPANYFADVEQAAFAPPISWMASATRRTGCCKDASCHTPTRIATASASTTSSCR